MAALIPGCCRKGRRNKFLPISIGSFIPGVGLDNELLPSQTQAAPEEGTHKQWQTF